MGAQLEEADLSFAILEEADLTGAQLKGAKLRFSLLKDANLDSACLKKVDLTEARLDGARIESIDLADENRVGPRLVDVRWNDVNLAVVHWASIEMLGDEYKARQNKQDGEQKEKWARTMDYGIAARANRQLSITLHAQGLNEDAARFAYRAPSRAAGTKPLRASCSRRSVSVNPE